MSTLPTPREAREAVPQYAGAAGLARLAKEVGRSVERLQLVERGYRPSELLSRRLCRRLGCDPKVYLQPAPNGRNYNKSNTKGRGRQSTNSQEMSRQRKQVHQPQTSEPALTTTNEKAR